MPVDTYFVAVFNFTKLVFEISLMLAFSSFWDQSVDPLSHTHYKSNKLKNVNFTVNGYRRRFSGRSDSLRTQTCLWSSLLALAMTVNTSAFAGYRIEGKGKIYCGLKIHQ